MPRGDTVPVNSAALVRLMADGGLVKAGARELKRPWLIKTLAHSAGVSAATVRRARLGASVRIDDIEKMAKALLVPVEALILLLPPGRCWLMDPDTGRESPALGLRPLERRPGDLSFVKWYEPGVTDVPGAQYTPGQPYDRANRALRVVKRLPIGNILWEEMYLETTGAQKNGKSVNKWNTTDDAAHHWIELHSDFGHINPLNNKRDYGLVLHRVDYRPLIDKLNPKSQKCLQFLIPKRLVWTEAKQLGSLFMRWSDQAIDASLLQPQLRGTDKVFEESNLQIRLVAADAPT